MSATITLYTRNILETGTLVVTGTPDTGYPESRLYDRQISLLWKDTVTEAKTFVVDQSASGILAVDFLAIEGHNFNGEDMQWQYSTTGAWAGEEVDAVTDWTQGDNAQITKTAAAAQTKRYWRVTVTSMANPKCGEIFMSFGYNFDVMVEPRSERTSLDNVSWRRTVGGPERSTKFGDIRRSRSYGLVLDSADLTLFRAAMSDLDEYSKPFYILDDEGAYYTCRLTDIPIERPLTGTNNEKQVVLNIIETL